MSDAPLFQNTDDQEAAYAPEELPQGALEQSRAALEDDTSGARSSAGDPVLPMVITGGTVSQPGTGSLGAAGNSGTPTVGVTAADDQDAVDDRTV